MVKSHIFLNFNGKNKRFLDCLTRLNSIMANPKIVVPRLKDLSLGLQDPKTFKRVKISKSLFRDFLININNIDHEESENRGPETLESILRAQELNVFLI